jgi:uncharacterized membrane protein YuzA (DUF378 family)
MLKKTAVLLAVIGALAIGIIGVRSIFKSKADESPLE